MATLNIRYFRKMAEDQNGYPMPIAEIGAGDKGEVVTYTTSTASGVVPREARFARFVADADAFIATGTAPTATTSDMRLEADQVEYFGLNSDAVRKGTLKIAAYDGTS